MSWSGIAKRSYQQDQESTRMHYDSNQSLQYLGFATSGTDTSADEWRIMRFSYDSSLNLTTILTADGDTNYDNVWDNRESISYS